MHNDIHFYKLNTHNNKQEDKLLKGINLKTLTDITSTTQTNNKCYSKCLLIVYVKDTITYTILTLLKKLYIALFFDSSVSKRFLHTAIMYKI